MERIKNSCWNNVTKSEQLFWNISDRIWDFAELAYEEYQSSVLLTDTLISLGFSVTKGIADMPTAFLAEWDSGISGPTIAFLGEYDALPMLSQLSNCTAISPLVEGAPGHGCGHNTMGAMQALAIISLKQTMEAEGIGGRLLYIGSPAEEVLGSRPFMIKADIFENVDVVLDCHAHNTFSAYYGTQYNATYSFRVSYRGATAHAGSSPWRGRSAADAVELMHAGTERMREHMTPNQRVHWSTMPGVGAPNVVPDFAETWYYVRDKDETIEQLFDWVIKCAEGAALMTQTTHSIDVLAACHQSFTLESLARLLSSNIEAVGAPHYTDEEQNIAKQVQQNSGSTGKGLIIPTNCIEITEKEFDGGSSDMGDVTLVCPTTTLLFPTFYPETDYHTWSVAAAGRSSYAHKGISTGAKAQVGLALDLLTSSENLKAVKTEHEVLKKQHPYRSFLPPNTRPITDWNQKDMAYFRPLLEKAIQKL